jgi:starch synthase
MTSLVPLYLKKAYNNEPIFEDSKIIFSAFENEADDNFKERFLNKASINDMTPEDLQDYVDGDSLNLNKGAIMSSDAVVVGSEDLTDFVTANAGDKVVLEYQSQEQLVDAYIGLYNSLVETEE